MVKDIRSLAEEEGQYQDIIVGGETIVEGWRDCEQRWSMIDKYIDKNSVVMDIGSHYGYFSKKIAEKYDDNLVWSIEPVPDRAEIQRLSLVKDKVKNVILSQYRLGLIDFVRLSRITEGIDTILMLSVIHYFEPKEIPEIINLCSKIAHTLIIEVPSKNEDDVAERNNVLQLDVERFLNINYDEVALIGESTSPKDPNVKRKIYRARNTFLAKENIVGYLDGDFGKTHYLEYSDARWYLDDKDGWIAGINYSTIMGFGYIYPDKKKLEKRIAERYFDVMKTKWAPTDISYHNAIVTPSSVEIIDYTEGVGSNIYGVEWSQYEDRVNAYSVKDFKNELDSRK